MPSLSSDPRSRGLLGHTSAVLLVLSTVNLLNYLDRYVLSAVLPWIESSFQLNDSQSGFLGSLFMLLYLLAAPFAGYIGDRRSRKFVVAGAPGILMSIVAAVVPEPERGSKDTDGESGLRLGSAASLDRIRRSPVWWYNTGGTAMMTFTAGGLAFWMPTYLVRHQQLTPEAAGNSLGLVLVLAGLVGTPLGGVLGDRAYRRRSGGHLALCAAALFATAPMVALIPLAPGAGQVLGLRYVVG